MLATEIFIRARVWLRLGSAHHKPGQGSPKKFQVWTFKIGLKIPHRSAYNFLGSGSNLTKLYQGTWLEAGMIKWTLILQRVHPTKFGRAKLSGIQRDFWQLSNCSRISPERIDNSTYRKSEKYLINYISSPIGRKKFGELWSTNNKVIDAYVDPLKWTFFGILNFGR